MKRFASAGARVRRGAGLRGKGAAALGAALLANCILVVDNEGDQCASDRDCWARGPQFAGFTCDGGQRVCIDPRTTNKFIDRRCTLDADCRESGAPYGNVVCSDQVCTVQNPFDECETNADCARRLGRLALCRRPERRCVAIDSEDCTPGEPLEAFDDENAVIFGTLLTNRGPYEASSLPLQNAVALAADQIKENVRGLPKGPNGAPRSLAFVFCHEGDDVQRAARHLTDTLRLPAIIGASISDFTIAAATAVTIPSRVLLVSPGATSISITGVEDQGLLWRTAPSDVVQSAALARLGEALQGAIRKELGAADASETPLRLAVINGNDAYGQGFANALPGQMTFNGKPLSASVADRTVFYGKDFDFSDEATADGNADAINEALVAFAPHLVVLIGSSDVATRIMAVVDEQFTGFRPYYLLADGAFGDELAGVLRDGEERGLRRRVRVTAPGAAGDTFSAYLTSYSRAFPDDGSVFGAAGAYDATYLLALAASSLAPGEVTGPNLAKALANTAPDPASPDREVFDVKSASDVGRYLTIMARPGGAVNYNGASGPLDFDVSTGEATADIQIFCADAPVQGALPRLRRTGQYYDALAGQLVGTDTCDSLPPPTPPAPPATP
ncbi:MAG TPA: hypothetical protein VFS00_29180 [Polyangiaceae bacterium]|nr:hypothetical protein [Polyangiaceae bacterium]